MHDSLLSWKQLHRILNLQKVKMSLFSKNSFNKIVFNKNSFQIRIFVYKVCSSMPLGNFLNCYSILVTNDLGDVILHKRSPTQY